MSRLDMLLAGLLLVFALRGFIRGLFREVFGFAALIVAVVAALEWTAQTATGLNRYIELPPAARSGIAFIAIFMGVHTVLNVLGFALDRLAAGLLFRSVNRVVGAAFGLGKGVLILAFMLLFVQLFEITPSRVDRQIRDSEIGRPLVELAKTMIRDRWEPVRPPLPSGEA